MEQTIPKTNKTPLKTANCPTVSAKQNSTTLAWLGTTAVVLTQTASNSLVPARAFITMPVYKVRVGTGITGEGRMMEDWLDIAEEKANL